MNRSTQIGLTVDWWVTLRDVPRVRQAILRAFLARWLPVVEKALAENRRSGHVPATWDQLATALDRRFASIWRAKTGKVSVGWYDAGLLAEVLRIRVEQLTPSRQQWLPFAAEYLCEGEITPCQAAAYARYRMATVADARSSSGKQDSFEAGILNQQSLPGILRELPAYPTTATIDMLSKDILQAASVIGQRVAALQNAATKRKKA